MIESAPLTTSPARGKDPAAEHRRIGVLRRLALLDTPADPAFDEIVSFAAATLGAPMAALALVDLDRQWFKAAVGLPMQQTGRDVAFCDHVVISDDEVVVADAANDPRFATNPLVTGEFEVRFYAGVPVRVLGEPIGALCIYDTVPREIDEASMATLRFLAHQAEHLVDLHGRRTAELPPSRQVVNALASRLTNGEAFDVVARSMDRPGWVYDDATLRFVAVNDIAVNLYGWTRTQFAQHTILDIRPPSDRRVLAAALENSDPERYVATRLWRHIRADGELIDVKITSAKTVFDGRPATLVLVTDVTTQLALGDALEHAAHVDALTGLANRREFIRTLMQSLDDQQRRIAVLFVDLDRFKLVNDTMGHDTGDTLLASAAARIRQCTPQLELVARLGGDEFAVMRGVRDISEAARFAELLREILEQPYVVDGGEHYVSASIGVAVSDGSSTAQSLLAEADAAMYAAKDNGRNGCALFDSTLRQEMAEWSQTQSDLHRAIEHHEIDLDLQPVVDLGTGTVAYEALARWNHPTRGRLNPAVFIHVAEESGLIRRLGAQLLALAASHAAELRAPISVNVSVHQFNRTLVHQVASLIELHGLVPGQLIIEVTESAVVDTEHAAVVLAGLREAGAEVWIDDFGTGYSSLGRLASLTVDGLKLPREFVNDLDTAHGWGIATAIVGIARALDIVVIAEGVETLRQFEQVQRLGCDAAQGFLLGHPRPFEHECARLGLRPGALDPSAEEPIWGAVTARLRPRTPISPEVDLEPSSATGSGEPDSDRPVELQLTPAGLTPRSRRPPVRRSVPLRDRRPR